MVQAKMKKKIKRLYKTRELVVYPSHGVGKVIGIEEQEIGGDILQVYVVSFEKEKMILRNSGNRKIRSKYINLI